MTLTAKLPTTCVESVSYSIDNGNTWVTTNNVDNEIVTITTPTVMQGNKVIWKGTAILYCTNTDPYPGSNIGYGYFTSTNNFNVSGNIMSLLYNDDFDDKVILPTLITTGAYAGVFSHIFGKGNCKIISAIDLKLPATTLTSFCYYNMFMNCTNLTSAPELPATILVYYCYSGMFLGCTNLTTAPELPATILEERCYQNMFYGCSSLNNITMLATDISKGTSLINWVYGVAATGTFTKAAAMTTLPTGVSGIPEGWAVQNASA